MDKMLVAVFDDLRRASAAAKTMKDRCESGALLAYALAVVAIDVRGISSVDFIPVQGEADPMLKSPTRNFLKLLAAPFYSLELGSSGAAAAAMIEKARLGIDAGFIDTVTPHLLPGRAAIVAEIEDQLAADLSTLVESHGGKIFSCARYESMDAQIFADIDALRGELQRLEHDLERAPDREKAQMEARVRLVRAKFLATKELARQQAASIRHEGEAKIVLLQQRATAASGDIKMILEKLANAARYDYADRATNLNLAWQFAGDGFAAAFETLSSTSDWRGLLNGVCHMPKQRDSRLTN
jgi:hypothetical protein